MWQLMGSMQQQLGQRQWQQPPSSAPGWPHPQRRQRQQLGVLLLLLLLLLLRLRPPLPLQPAHGR
jgi:hypothetical protein